MPMPEGEFVTGWFTPLSSVDLPKPLGLGGRPEPPIVLPPLPGVWPKPGEPSLPIVIPPGKVEQPIVLPGTPEHPITLPPGSLWPPLPPEVVPPQGVNALLVLVVGLYDGDVYHGYRWYMSDASVAPPIALPPTPQPKR